METQNETVTILAINQEIQDCEQVISEFTKKRNDLKDQLVSLNKRLAVLYEVQDELTDVNLRLINDANIKIILDKRFDLQPEYSRYIKTVENYNGILEVLKKLREKYEDQ